MTRLARSLLVLLALGLGAGVEAAETVKHSGTVVAIDPQEGVLVIEEVGPWRVEQGRTVVTRRVIQLRPTTTFFSHIRVNVPGQFGGDFLEVALEADAVTPGDFATAECVQEDGRLVARRVTLAELD